MNIIITTKQHEVPQETKDYVHEKVSKFEKYLKIRKTEVIMDKEGGSLKIDIIVSPDKGNPIVSAVLGDDWLSTADQTVEKIEKQLRKIKGKVKSHRVSKFKPEEKIQNDKEETYQDVVDNT